MEGQNYGKITISKEEILNFITQREKLSGKEKDEAYFSVTLEKDGEKEQLRFYDLRKLEDDIIFTLIIEKKPKKKLINLTAFPGKHILLEGENLKNIITICPSAEEKDQQRE